MAGPNILNPDPLTAPVDDDPLTGPAAEEEDALINDPGFWDYVKDIPGSIASGLEKNISSYPGTGGDVYNLAAAGDIVARKYFGGADEARVKELREGYEKDRLLPTSEEVHDYLSPNAYTPKTGLGRGIEEVTSLISPQGALRGATHLARDVILPYAGSKLGEWAGSYFGPEEAELLSAGGGIAAGPTGEVAKRVAVRTLRGDTSPEAATTMRTLQGVDTPLTPELPNQRTERIRRLADEGVEVTAGQALGSEGMRRLEAGPFSGKGGTLNQQQGRQLTRAVLQRIGINADIASPEVMNAAQDRFSQDYQSLIQQNRGVVMDPTLEAALTDIGAQFEDMAGTAQGTPVAKFYDRIINAAHQHGGVIPPDVFNVIHSELAANIRASGKSPNLSSMTHALREMQDALYDTIGRNGQPEVQTMARDLNNRYRNFKIVEKSVGGAGEGVSFGLVSPEKLRAELEKRDPGAYARGQGDFARLVRDAQSLAALPVTGTGAQNVTSSLPGLAHAAMVAPFSSVLTSRPVRTSIVNRATGLNPDWINPMQMPPIVGLANQADQEEPVPVELPAPDQQSLLLDSDVMPAPVELPPAGGLPPRAQAILRNRGLA